MGRGQLEGKGLWGFSRKWGGGKKGKVRQFQVGINGSGKKKRKRKGKLRAEEGRQLW